MTLKKISLIVIILTLFSVGSCDQEEAGKVQLEVTDVNLKDIGKHTVSIRYAFEIAYKADNVKKCTIITRYIKKNNTIESINVFVQGAEVTIDVIASPHDFDCSNDSCFTAHELQFNIVGLNKGYYNINTRVNYASEPVIGITVL